MRFIDSMEPALSLPLRDDAEGEAEASAVAPTAACDAVATVDVRLVSLLLLLHQIVNFVLAGARLHTARPQTARLQSAATSVIRVVLAGPNPLDLIILIQQSFRRRPRARRRRLVC